MGCYVHVEVKINNKWEHYTKGRLYQDYRLFSKMASEPKGLPEDLSVLTAFDKNVWGAYGYSHSWLSSEEVSHIEKWYEELTDDFLGLSRQLGYFWGNSFASFVSHPEDYPDGVQDFRWVFWLSD